MLIAENGGVYVSGEMITIVLSALGLILALTGGFGWLIHRIDGVRDEIDGVRDEIVEVKLSVAEVKISVARLEGRMDACSGPSTERGPAAGLQLK